MMTFAPAFSTMPFISLLNHSQRTTIEYNINEKTESEAWAIADMVSPNRRIIFELFRESFRCDSLFRTFSAIWRDRIRTQTGDTIADGLSERWRSGR